MIFEFSFHDILSIITIIFLSIIIFVNTVKHLMQKNKYIKSNIFKLRKTFFLISLSFSLIIVFAFFNWTTTNTKNKITVDIDYEEFLDIEIPPTVQKEKKVLPKPPPTVIEEIPEDELSQIEQPEFLSVDVGVDDKIEFDDFPTYDKPEPSLPLPPKQTDNDLPIIIAEVMPRFPGCEDKGTIKEKELCAQEKLMEFIYSNIQYPAIARESNIEGRVVIKFVVNKSGKISDVSILRDIGGGCGKAAVEAVNKMNKLKNRWTPGRQGGKKVNVWFTLPVVFKLN